MIASFTPREARRQNGSWTIALMHPLVYYLPLCTFVLSLIFAFVLFRHILRKPNATVHQAVAT